jgi:hypothetical protein
MKIEDSVTGRQVLDKLRNLGGILVLPEGGSGKWFDYLHDTGLYRSRKPTKLQLKVADSLPCERLYVDKNKALTKIVIPLKEIIRD